VETATGENENGEQPLAGTPVKNKLPGNISTNLVFTDCAVQPPTVTILSVTV
jgi:hypothetical protein